jgi:hypothetical protein
VQSSYDHDHQSFQEKLLRVDDGSAPAAARRRLRRRARNTLDKANQLDKNTVVSDHGEASESSVLGYTPSSEASRSRASPDEILYL